MDKRSVRKIILMVTLVGGMVLIVVVAGAIAWVDAKG